MPPPLAVAATRHAHSATTLLVHVVWSTHRRAPWLDVSFDHRLAELVAHLATRVGARALAVGNGIDHVHVVARHPPTVAVSDVVQRLKGASARAMRAAVPHAAGHLWQAGYWAESLGPFELPTVVAYVRGQRAHHARQREVGEPWESALA
jgi:REP element-mobilizing transposase RayT